MRCHFKTILLVTACLPNFATANDFLTIAVASNFTGTAKEIVASFSAATDVSVRISAGSTGKLYAQIVNGAPFDIFLAADATRPELLERSGHAVVGTRFTYAIGALVLWSQDAKLKGRDCHEALQAGAYDRVALANPRTAPYGQAARDVLVAAGLWEAVSARAVLGENITQTFQFVATGNATLGFVARSQALDDRFDEPSCAWPVPSSLHRDLHQQAVILSGSSQKPVARQFLQYMRSPEVTAILNRHGYTISQ
jgi:molybdate transport system substrate-binding protein